MPRIIAGRAGGIPLVAPKGQDTRPTADKTKEALFSIVQNRIPDSQWLDLYAGTGQIGLEAVSRGAALAVLVEQARASLAAIDANLAKSGLAGQVTVSRNSANAAVRQFIAEERRFDVIFLDPPYRQALQDFAKLAPDLVRILQPDGLVILEHESRETPADFVTELKRTRSCQYGTAMLSFYRV